MEVDYPRLKREIDCSVFEIKAEQCLSDIKQGYIINLTAKLGINKRQANIIFRKALNASFIAEQIEEQCAFLMCEAIGHEFVEFEVKEDEEE